jgi:predicted acylesterase/phospholipase RssA
MFRVLSLDGGGIRGAFIAACLARIEAETQRRISDYFDLIVGTSTGGIVALALALGEPASRVLELYRNSGRAIFTRRQPPPIPLLERLYLSIAKRYRVPALDLDALYRAKYSDEPLRAALSAVFGVRTLGDITRCRVVIPSIDLVRGQTITFKTAHQPGFMRDLHLLAVDAALATSAAPTYFPQASLAGRRAYTDGGLWANNPALVGYAEAAKISQVCNRPGIDPAFGLDDIWMLSIGTGKPQYYAKPGATDDGLIWWGERIFDVAGGAQSQGVHFQAQYLMGAQRYTRIDFDMPTAPWALDDVSVVDDLVHFGEQAAVAAFPQIAPTFLTGGKTAFQPFQAVA